MFLRLQGVNTDVRTVTGDTAMSLALGRGHTKIVSLIGNHKSSIAPRGDPGCTTEARTPNAVNAGNVFVFGMFRIWTRPTTASCRTRAPSDAESRATVSACT